MNTLEGSPLPSATDVRDPGGVAHEAPLPQGEMAELFLTLEKAVRAQRLYQRNNPVYHGFITAARSAVARLWDRTSTLTVGIEENGFKWYGRVYPAGEGRDSLPFLFYKDGIRYFTILPGFEDELERFLDIVNRARVQDQVTNDDMVTLLWQAELSAFQYSFVDALAEGLQVPESKVPKLAGMELTLVPEGSPEAGPMSAPQPAAVEAGEPTVAGLINREDFAETLYFLEPRELNMLRREVAMEMERDVKVDVVNALFDRLEDGHEEWRTEILRILRQIIPVFLGAGDLRSASAVLQELTAIIQRGGLEGEYRREAERLFEQLSEPEVLTQLTHSLEDGSIDPSGEELSIFLNHLGPAAMPLLLRFVERGGMPLGQARFRAAMERLGGENRPQVVALISGEDEDVARGAARLAGKLGIGEAAAPLAELYRRGVLGTRMAVVDALIRIRNSTALDALIMALEDEDRDTRIAAARGLASLRYAPSRDRLQTLLEGRQVRDADLTEQIAFFEAFGAVASPDQVSMLDRMLNGRRLFAKETPELRACAAMALGRVDAPSAKAALQRSAEDPNPMVRTAVQRALRQETGR